MEFDIFISRIEALGRIGLTGSDQVWVSRTQGSERKDGSGETSMVSVGTGTDMLLEGRARPSLIVGQENIAQ